MTNDLAGNLQKLIENKQAKIGVVGLGYVGLPLIDAFIKGGFSAIGYDVDQRKIDSLSKGGSYIAHIPSSKIKGWIEAGQFSCTSDMSRLAGSGCCFDLCADTAHQESRS